MNKGGCEPKILTVNLHVPGSGQPTTHESLAGPLGIPELMPPNRRQTFKAKEW